VVVSVWITDHSRVKNKHIETQLSECLHLHIFTHFQISLTQEFILHQLYTRASCRAFNCCTM